MVGIRVAHGLKLLDTSPELFQGEVSSAIMGILHNYMPTLDRVVLRGMQWGCAVFLQIDGLLK